MNNLLFYNERDPSSAGEHYAEDVGVPGSTPGGPIYFFLKKFYNRDVEPSTPRIFASAENLVFFYTLAFLFLKEKPRNEQESEYGGPIPKLFLK